MNDLEGPFVKTHPVWAELNRACGSVVPSNAGRTYETGDGYATIWLPLPSKEAVPQGTESKLILVAIQIRERANAHFGYCILAAPEFIPASDDCNPYTVGAVALQVLPKSVGERAAQYGGDPLKAALAECAKAGVVFRFSENE